MMLSYSFDTGMTCGYVKATERMDMKEVLDDLILCGRPVSHPMLLPILTLCNELSSKSDKTQRGLRKEIRKLDKALDFRYSSDGFELGYNLELDPGLERISKTIADFQISVLQTNPRAWQDAVDNARRAVAYFWDHTAAEKKHSTLRELHEALTNRLEFLTVKLRGIDTYADVTLEKLGVLREMVRWPNVYSRSYVASGSNLLQLIGT